MKLPKHFINGLFENEVLWFANTKVSSKLKTDDMKLTHQIKPMAFDQWTVERTKPNQIVDEWFTTRFLAINGNKGYHYLH